MIIPISYKQIKKLIQSDEGIVELLENCEIVFDEIDSINKEFLNDTLSFVDYNRITKKLTAYIMFLKPMADKGEVYRHNVRNEKVVEFKLQGDKAMTGVVLTSRSQVAVKNYYDLVTMITGYISRCYCGIKECERQMLSMKYEFKNTGVGEDTQ